MQSIKTFSCLILIVLINIVFTWYQNQAQDAGPDVPSGKLRSLSFAPYQDGFSPNVGKFPLPEHVDADLGTVADKTYTIRTYSVGGGMQPTPEFARKHGVDMIMGGWLGDGHKENKLEIAALIQAANQNQDVVKRVIVGNEVLLRKDMDIDTLIGYIRQVKQAIVQPVTFADVWSSYIQYPQLFNEVDFITIHILPYWEDEPVAIEQAIAHVEKIVKQIEDKAHSMGVNKPILIGESGWPAVGRQRGSAVPSVVNETRFIRNLIQAANRHGFDYNIVEAFNQPWKSNNEGVVGANWGLLNIDREPVFPLTGPVFENPNWHLELLWSVMILLIAAIIFFKSLKTMSLTKILAFLTLAQLFSICLITMTDLLWHTSYNLWQQMYCVLIVSSNVLLSSLLLQRYSDLFNNRPTAEILAKILRISYLLFAGLALFKTYHLALNARYLSFESEQFAIPVLGILSFILYSALEQKTLNWKAISLPKITDCNLQSNWEHYFSYLLTYGIPAVVIGECYIFMSGYDFKQTHPDLLQGIPIAMSYSLENQQLLCWLFYILILTIPFWHRPTESLLSKHSQR